MKTPEELKAIKEEELTQVTGGNDFPSSHPPCYLAYPTQKPINGSCNVANDHPDCAVCPSNPKNNNPSYPISDNPFGPYVG